MPLLFFLFSYLFSLSAIQKTAYHPKIRCHLDHTDTDESLGNITKKAKENNTGYFIKFPFLLHFQYILLPFVFLLPTGLFFPVSKFPKLNYPRYKQSK